MILFFRLFCHLVTFTALMLAAPSSSAETKIPKMNDLFAIKNIKQSQELKINSDQLLLDRNNFRATLKDNVVLYFDTYTLYTDELVINYDPENKELKTIIVTRQLKIINNNCQDEIAIADMAEYDNKSHKLLLKGNVVAKKDDYILKTEQIIYNVKLKPREKANAQ